MKPVLVRSLYQGHMNAAFEMVPNRNPKFVAHALETLNPADVWVVTRTGVWERYLAASKTTVLRYLNWTTCRDGFQDFPPSTFERQLWETVEEYNLYFKKQGERLRHGASQQYGGDLWVLNWTDLNFHVEELLERQMFVEGMFELDLVMSFLRPWVFEGGENTITQAEIDAITPRADWEESGKAICNALLSNPEGPKERKKLILNGTQRDLGDWTFPLIMENASRRAPPDDWSVTYPYWKAHRQEGAILEIRSPTPTDNQAVVNQRNREAVLEWGRNGGWLWVDNEMVEQTRLHQYALAVQRSYERLR